MRAVTMLKAWILERAQGPSDETCSVVRSSINRFTSSREVEADNQERHDTVLTVENRTCGIERRHEVFA
jgi:hypothetical protein